VRLKPGILRAEGTLSRIGAPGILVLVIIAIGTLIVPLDTSVNIAFPAITERFGLGRTGIQWVVICYVLTYGSLMLGIGRLGDIFGYLRVFRLGLAWSILAFILCATAENYAWLLAARVMQGIGAALVIGCGPALATSHFTEDLRPRILGFYALGFAAGGGLGPLIGGVLVEHFGWSAVYWYRAPLAAFALALSVFLRTPKRAAVRESFDLTGAVLITGMMCCLLLGINRAPDIAAGNPLSLALAFGFLILGWWYGRHAGRIARAVIALKYFRDADFLFACIATAVVNFACFAVLLFLPYLLLHGVGLPAGWGGLVLAIGHLAAMAASPFAGFLLARISAARLALIGSVMTALGLWLIGAVGAAGGALFLLVAALALQGIGLGLFQVSVTDLLLERMPREDRGVAGSLSQVSRTLGVVTAASLLSTVFAALEVAGLARGLAGMEAFRAAFGSIFSFGAALVAALVVVGFFVNRRGYR
jgi:MFS family permease